MGFEWGVKSGVEQSQRCQIGSAGGKRGFEWGVKWGVERSQRCQIGSAGVKWGVKWVVKHQLGTALWGAKRGQRSQVSQGWRDLPLPFLP